MKKAKITFAKPNLSALAIANLARALNSEVQIAKGKP